jgi:hypothetical protein
MIHNMILHLTEEGQWGEGLPMPSTIYVLWTEVPFHYRATLYTAVSFSHHIIHFKHTLMIYCLAH